MHNREQNIGTLSKLLIFSAAAAVLCNYYYLYFIQFSEGAAEAGAGYSALKLCGILLVCISLFSAKIKTSYKQEEVLLLIFFLLAITIFTFKSVIFSLSDIMFLNTAICIIPLMLLSPKQPRYRINTFFESCLFIMTCQIIIDFAIYFNNRSIWDNKAFIGGLGNPSSFGLVCNLLITYLLFYRPSKATSLLYFPTLVVGVYMTNSMLSLIALMIIFGTWATTNFSAKRLLAALIAISITAALSSYLMSDHLAYKLQSAINLFNDEAASDGSRSVSLRMQIHNEYITNFLNHPFDAVLYGFSESSYMKYDSQVLTYTSSFGLFCSALFFLFFTVALFKSHRNKMAFQTISLAIFGITLLTNRILDYYPIPIFLALILIMSRKEKTSELEVVPSLYMSR
ncbi:hypothetical protein V9K90_19425 [Pseudomonas sp. CCNWLW56]|uniref:hypothetical protein n=1 Tax=unclassified Pseudomonas TaxID=196821 RepID=UPI0030772283